MFYFSKLRYSIIALLLLSFSSAFARSDSDDESITQIDRIIAVVDNSVITQNELNERVKIVQQQLEKQGNELPPTDVLRKQVLERLINDRLQLQLAAQTGLKVDDNQLNKTIERIAQQNKLTVQAFKEALEQEGIKFNKFKEDIRKEIILARLREREVENRLNITESEVDNFLTTQASRKEDPDEFEISHILIRTNEDGSPEEIQKLKAKAELALQKIKDGMDFSQVSASFSDAPNALEGGKLGWKTTTQIPGLFLDALKPMKSGEVSSLLRSANGFHILKLTDRRGGSSPLVIQQTHVRHILIKPSEIVSDNEAQRRIGALHERLDNGGDFAEIAKLNSEDGTASKGGDLGWLNPGDTLPEFEKAMNALAINEISSPVHTQFGWHLIQVVERRTQDMSKESARLKARQEIRARKSDEAFQDWLRELRDRAFVEYRLEDKY